MTPAREYDLVRLTPGGVTITHYACAITTDGPWLVFTEPATSDQHGALIATYPAHVVVELEPCEGRCRRGGE